MTSPDSLLPTFHVLDDTRPHDTSLPAFMVSTTRGFLPRMDPVVSLPPEFHVLESILSRMPIKTVSGEEGLLAQGKLGHVVHAELPDLTDAVDKYRDNLPLQNALYRDYSFLASAYLLEPCHMNFIKEQCYGLGRDVLPCQVSRPIARCAELASCGFKPFMEYAGAYALFNYRLVDPRDGLAWDNIRLIRAFEHGLDPTSPEAGFVITHIAMVKHSGLLVKGVMQALDTCNTGQPSRSAFNTGLSNTLSALVEINATMEGMWTKSKPGAYTSFRTFIFGITSQSMFPNGVVYEGINDDQPMAFRGETGANDSMVPLMDNFLQIGMPDTPLTEILKDFRSYRPGDHKRFLEWVSVVSETRGVRDLALGLNGAVGEESKQSRILWLKLLNQVRDFRWRHWCFAREYILKQTRHPTATGGSPIVTWLPNQLRAVMEDMQDFYTTVGAADARLGHEVDDMMDLVTRQRHMLQKEVAKYCAERAVAAAAAAVAVPH